MSPCLGFSRQQGREQARQSGNREAAVRNPYSRRVVMDSGLALGASRNDGGNLGGFQVWRPAFVLCSTWCVFRSPILPDGQITCLRCPSPIQKIFPFSFEANHRRCLRRPCPREGRFATVTDVGQGCGGRKQRRRANVIAGRGPTRERSQARRRTALMRTVKSWGPDASTLGSSLRRRVGPTGLGQPYSLDDGDNQARSPGSNCVE